MKRITLITGHYGSGKTNFAVNLALRQAAEGKKVTVVDLDIVNPYFRTHSSAEKASGRQEISHVWIFRRFPLTLPGWHMRKNA